MSRLTVGHLPQLQLMPQSYANYIYIYKDIISKSTTSRLENIKGKGLK